MSQQQTATTATYTLGMDQLIGAHFINDSQAEDTQTFSVESVFYNDTGTRSNITMTSITEVFNYFVVLFGVFVIIATIFGNSLVILAIIRDKKLRRVGNIFIVNLAISDLLVGIIVTPLSLVYQINVTWPFGRHLCNFWISIDIICCTASILNLCVISYDRFHAISHPLKYAKHRTAKRAFILISVVWIYSIIIALPPLLGWRLPGEFESTVKCEVTKNVGYTFYSTIGAFGLPLVFMVFFYSRIFSVTSNRGRQWVQGPGSSCRFRNKRSRSRFDCDSDNKVANCLMCSSSKCKEDGMQQHSPHSDMDTRSSRVNSIPSVLPASVNTSGLTRQTTVESLPYPGALRRQSTVFCSRGSLAASENNDVVLEITQGRRKQTIQRRRLMRQISNTTSDGSYTSTTATTSSTGFSETSFSTDSAQSKTHNNKRTTHVLQNLLAANIMAAEILQESIKGVHYTGSIRAPLSPLLSTDDTDKDELEPLKEVIDQITPPPRPHRKRKKKKKKVSSLPHERRAVKTLGIVVGCFTLCWLPFFIVTLVKPWCQTCVGPLVTAIVLWLGYCNSACNPVIYTFFNEDFRRAFRKLNPFGRYNAPTFL